MEIIFTWHRRAVFETSHSVEVDARPWAAAFVELRIQYSWVKVNVYQYLKYKVVCANRSAICVANLTEVGRSLLLSALLWLSRCVVGNIAASALSSASFPLRFGRQHDR